jgi:hypothetical protein
MSPARIFYWFCRTKVDATGRPQSKLQNGGLWRRYIDGCKATPLPVIANIGETRRHAWRDRFSR